MTSHQRDLLTLATLACLFISPTTRGVDFQRDVRPILSDQCFKCHGPDEATREVDLRLDTSAGAAADLGGYSAVIAGDPEESELIARITDPDPDLRMPPAGSGKSLSEQQIETLRAWVASGAEYEQHWAFAPIKRLTPPKVIAEAWIANPIDRFVLARLEADDLQPAAEADRYTLARRVHLDLIGLPPTPEEADRFVGDRSPDAYERLVDRLLSSPHYGERWARRWLDLARYSDTKGYEKDQPRTMWLYRDWVIDAINDDMPFDQFTIEQIAGDMLPDASLRQRVATGFHRNTMTNEEGGIDPQEYRFQSIVDRVATTGTAWLGLTLGCAQCHTHKYDPITHAEYYGVFAMLNNADELEIDVPTSESTAERNEALARVQQERELLAERFPVEGESSRQSRQAAVRTAFEAWVSAQRNQAVAWRPLTPTAVNSNLPTTEILSDGSVLVSGDVTKNDIYTVTVAPGQETVAAIRIEALPHESLPHHGPGRQVITDAPGGAQGNFLLTEVVASIVEEGNEPHPLAWRSASADFVPEGVSADHAIDGRHDTGWSINGREGKRHAIQLTFDEPITLEEGQRFRIQLQHESYYPAGLGRFRISFATHAPAPGTAGHTDEVVALLLSGPEGWSDQQRQQVLRRFLATTPALEQARSEIVALEAAVPRHATALVMHERQRDPRVTRRHHRGEYLSAEEVVQPGLPEVLPGFPAGQRADRLGLARWLVDERNPLTPRVVVNRNWQAFFGQGVVKTLEDFGYQGEYPSHPRLLDWLASEFVASGWSRKELHRLIVTSATYKQAASNPGATEVDPENRLLARAPRVRLDAELVRDSVLTISGQLSRKIGGPSVFPPQPPGITERSYGPLNWVVSEGEDRYRRGLYTFNKRTAPFAAFGLFDAPSGEFCVARRDRSNTPLQALALLNDQTVSEAARSLAMSCLDTSATGDQVAARMFRRCVIRPPTESELDSVLEYAARQRERFSRRELDALLVLGIGPSRTWDFSEDADGWVARHHSSVNVSNGVLSVTNDGDDPYISAAVEGPGGEYTVEVSATLKNHTGPLELFWTTHDRPSESPEMRSPLAPTDTPGSYSGRFVAAGPLRTLRLDTGAGPGETHLYEVRLRYGDGQFDGSSIDDPIELATWQMTARAMLNLDEVVTKP